MNWWCINSIKLREFSVDVYVDTNARKKKNKGDKFKYLGGGGVVGTRFAFDDNISVTTGV